MMQGVPWHKEGTQSEALYRGHRLKVHYEKGWRAFVDKEPLWRPRVGEVFATKGEAMGAAIKAADWLAS